MTVHEAAAILEYDRIVQRIEDAERKAGIPVGSWRATEARTWQLAVQAGLRRHIALRERELRGRSQ